jgi:hypothetical protein
MEKTINHVLISITIGASVPGGIIILFKGLNKSMLTKSMITGGLYGSILSIVQNGVNIKKYNN